MTDSTYRMDPRLNEAFKLCLADLYEANIACQIYIGYSRHHENLAKESTEHQQVWRFLEQAVYWRMALAINRMVQPRGSDKNRASIFGLIEKIKAAHKQDSPFSFPERLNSAFAEADSLYENEILQTLKDSRDSFMAHTLIDRSRKGVSMYDLSEALGPIESVVESLHYAVFGTFPPLNDHQDKWQERVKRWFERTLKLKPRELHPSRFETR